MTLRTFFIFFLLSNAIKGQPIGVPQTMVVFMATACPICQYYTPLLKQISQQSGFHSSNFLLAFTTGDSVQIAQFERKYQTGWRTIGGLEAQKLAQLYQASVTPELIVLSQNEQVIYRGRLSNAYVAPGRKRIRTSLSEIDTLYQAYTLQKPIGLPAQPAIGCLMNP